MKTKLGHVSQMSNGTTLLHSLDGSVLATFNDWQVAEQVLRQQDDIEQLEMLVNDRDDKLMQAVEDKQTLEYKIEKLESINDDNHRLILDLEKEVDTLKTKLWNFTNDL